VIYVHIPFCRSFCTYCDFYSEVAAKCRRAEDAAGQESLFNGFSMALGREIAERKDEISDRNNTLYIGGGTPSVLPLHVYEQLVDDLASAGVKAPFDEFTFEVNPEDIIEKGTSYVEGLMRLGVNRFSMGVQSFDDGILKWMNRRHDAAAARKAYGILEAAGADNISIDLIFGLPQLSDRKWEDTMKKALEISSKGVLPRHISSYQLSVEPGSALAKLQKRGVWEEASEEQCARQYAMLCETLGQAGYCHYEISNFALPGFEARHNSAYWTHVPYVGLGPGAHSLSIPVAEPASEGQMPSPRRRWNDPDLKAYVTDPASVVGYEDLDEEQLVMEKIMLALRTADGIPEAFLRAHADPVALSDALSEGSLVPSDVCGNLRIPENRFFISDNIISLLVI